MLFEDNARIRNERYTASSVKKAVAYYRVSTKRQGKSGLGLEAQRISVRQFASLRQIKLLYEFVEVEKGKIIERPILKKALDECIQQNATLLIAKVDRLARRVLFISTLMESNVSFIAVDKPYADEYELHMEAANAQRESKLISKRTREALQAAKLRGIKLGTGIRKVHRQQRMAYRKYSIKMKPNIKRLKQKGFTTVRSIVVKLNEKNIKTFRGGTTKWHVSTVHRLLKQLGY